MSSPIALQELFKAGFEDFVIPSYETAPYTTITNRAQVTRSLKAIAGVERVHVKGLNRLQNEFGPNGEQVFEAENKDARVRFVGSGWYGLSDTNAARPTTISTTDYFEVTFYGTGLNWLTAFSASQDARVSVDGGSEGSNILTALSNVLNGRSYALNVVMPVTSGLSLGWHTIKIRNNNAAGINVYGFEILNERSNLAVYSGAGISNGSFNGLSSLATSAFNDGVVGTRGARVVKYIENGTLKSDVQEVDSTAKYLTLADHTNEEVVRRINFREFGANRADDFSTLANSNSDRAFTLDDGTTTLLANDVNDGAVDSVGTALVGGFVTITFVGTGLDVIYHATTAGLSAAQTISVDGVDILTNNQFSVSAANIQILKIVSGLPYGTHTVKILKTILNGVWDFRIKDFIIYQPKKPSIPAGALEVADYNLMASFVAPTQISGEISSVGVLRKQITRELVYSGTWAAFTFATNYPSGFFTSTSTASSYVEYTFWGTGVVYHMGTQALAQSHTISINGSVNVSGFTVATNLTSGYSFNSTTGVLSGTPVNSTMGSSIAISGLPLGRHTIRVAWTSGAAIFPGCFDIITPIHINNSNLKVGNQSLKSVTKYSPEKSVSNAGPDLSKAKAWAIIDGPNNRILGSQNISAFLATATGNYLIHFEKPFKTSSYAAIGSCMAGTSKPLNFDVQRANSIKVYTTTDAGFFEANTFSVAFFGELIDE